MASLDHARIASLVTSVDEHIDQISELAERLATDGDDDIAAALFEAERSLQMAARALERAATRTRG